MKVFAMETSAKRILAPVRGTGQEPVVPRFLPEAQDSLGGFGQMSSCILVSACPKFQAPCGTGCSCRSCDTDSPRCSRVSFPSPLLPCFCRREIYLAEPVSSLVLGL